MDLIVDGFIQAFRLLMSWDREVAEVTLLSLKISGAATLISTVIGITAGTAVALLRFPGKRFLISVVNTGMGLPPVVVGLFVTIFIWRSGPLGSLGLLYTPAAMVLAQVVIAAPIITGVSLAAMQRLPGKLRLQILALGATRRQMVWLLMKEARLPLLTAVMAGFGGVISEIGASIMVGREHQGIHPRAHHRHGDGDRQGEFRPRHSPRRHPADPGLHGQLHTHRGPAEENEMSAVIEIRDLRIIRNGMTALDVPRLSFEEGRISSLIGPNGAGKSTLLLSVMRLVRPDSGEMLYRGKNSSSGEIGP